MALFTKIERFSHQNNQITLFLFDRMLQPDQQNWSPKTYLFLISDLVRPSTSPIFLKSSRTMSKEKLLKCSPIVESLQGTQYRFGFRSWWVVDQVLLFFNYLYMRRKRGRVLLQLRNQTGKDWCRFESCFSFVEKGWTCRSPISKHHLAQRRLGDSIFTAQIRSRRWRLKC